MAWFSSRRRTCTVVYDDLARAIPAAALRHHEDCQGKRRPTHDAVAAYHGAGDVVVERVRERTMATHVLVMDETGRLTPPEEVRRALGLSGVTTPLNSTLMPMAVSSCSVPPFHGIQTPIPLRPNNVSRWREVRGTPGRSFECGGADEPRREGGVGAKVQVHVGAVDRTTTEALQSSDAVKRVQRLVG